MGGLVGGLGELIYLGLGGQLIVPFTGLFEYEVVRAFIGAVVGAGAGWLVGRRLRREHLLPAMPA